MNTGDQSINSSFVAMLTQYAKASEATSSSSPGEPVAISTGSFSASTSTTSIRNPFTGGLSAAAQDRLKETLSRAPF